MQSQQMAAMAMNPNAIPPDGTPVMGNMQRPQPPQTDPREQLNTYIYDYFIRNNHVQLARVMLDCDLKVTTLPNTKPSPSGRNVNGVDAMEDSKDDLPKPKLPSNQIVENSFLLDWWVQFWDIFHAARNRQNKSSQYIAHTRSLTQMQSEQRNQRMVMNGPGMGAQAQYQNMMRGVPNGMNPNDLKRAAALNARNPNGNPMANPMNKQAMMSAQMQRDGSSMDMNGQRGQSPNSNENGAPSPNKRPRMDGGMANMPANQFNEFAQQAQNAQQKNIEVYAQSLAQQQRMALNNSAIPQGMNSGVQGSPLNQQGLDGQQELFAGNQPRAPGMPAGAPGAPQGNHALQDYQMQLMLLEQQNKKRLLMARQEQDNMSGPHPQGGVGAPGFPPNMSPGASRAGPSPNPTDQMKRTPKLNQQGLPGSPMPDAPMQQQRNSPTPMNFDPNAMPPGMPPQFYNQMQPNNVMRPPSSHPGGFNGQQLTPQQMEQMRQNGGMVNGAWRGPPQPGMMPGQPGMAGGPMAGNPQQRNQMPPPPAPPAGEQPRAEPSPSQSSQPAPPTPQQTNKANPNKKKNTKDTKKPAKNKGPNAGATPAASGGEEPPTPTPQTPITPMAKTFQPNGAQAGQPPAQAQAPAAAQPAPMDNSNGPFGDLGNDPPGFDIGGLNFGDETFDFDSFLQVGDDAGGFGLGNEFNFDAGVEAGDAM